MLNLRLDCPWYERVIVGVAVNDLIDDMGYILYSV